MAKGEIKGMPYEKPGPAKGHAYGIAAVTQALDGVDFPASRRDLIRRVGNETIEWHKGEPVSLKWLLEELTTENFTSMAAVTEAVGAVLRREGGVKAQNRTREPASR